MRFSRPLVLLILLAALIAPAALAQEAAVVTLQPVAFVPLEGETFTTDVTIENATDLLGFQFDLNFDPAAFAVDSIELGPFLSSTGRSAQPLGPDLRAAGEGRAVYGGFTLGTPEQPGAAGSGVLATVTWRVVQPADFTATLSRVQLAGPGGQALPGSDTSSLPPAAATVEQPAVEQPTVAAPEPTPAPATENQTGSGLAGPAGLVAILVITGGLYALWRISHKPGGNRSAD
jgi:hypothetical protein